MKFMAFAVLTAVVGAGAALAQSDGPAELPDAEYQGQSYVDSQGCIFLRAGYGGTASWVPRVGQDRKPVCGQTPTLTVVKVVSASAEIEVAPARRAVVKRRVAKAAFSAAPVMISCPVSVPVARRYATTDGGSVVVCTATNGSLTGARSPIYPAGSGVGAALSSARHAGVAIPLGHKKTASAQGGAGFAPPKGYEVAWKDGRLNPLRGKGTAAGQAAQDKIWTRNVPAVAVVAKPRTKAAAQTTKSASNGTGRAIYVQVGAFGLPSNADGAAARLAALGLPVSRSKGGRALQVVFAGPFASGADANAALKSARKSGFSDAFIR